MSQIHTVKEEIRTMVNEIEKPWSVKLCHTMPPEENCFVLRVDTYEAVICFLGVFNAVRGFDDCFVIIARSAERN